MLETFADERRRERNRAEVVERDDEAALGGRWRKDIRLQRKLKFVQCAAHRSRQPLRARGRGHAAGVRTNTVRKSITLLMLLLSVSAGPFVAADVVGGGMADAAPSTMNLSNFRTAVADAKALVDNGDFAAARTPPRGS